MDATYVPSSRKTLGGCKKRVQKATDTAVTYLGEATLPSVFDDILKRGPKFSLEPRSRKHELLAVVHRVADKAPFEEKARCVSEGVDCLMRTWTGRRQPSRDLRPLVAHFQQEGLSLLQADKEASADAFRLPCAGGVHFSHCELLSWHVDTTFCAPSSSTATSSTLPARILPIKGTPAPSISSGHGNPVVTMSTDVPLSVQVGGRKYCCRSNCLFLIVLPCPRTLLVCFSDCISIVGLLLKLSGDVEENPGPDTMEMIQQVIASQTEILSKLSEMQENQTSSEARILDMQSRLSAIEQKLQTFDESRDRLSKLETFAERCEIEMTTVSRKLDELENRSRRNNLIVRGVKEEESESEEDLLQKVNNDIFDKILKQRVDTIERIHRLGKREPGRDRPIIIKLTDFRDKMKIMSNCFNLKGTQFSVNEDFSKRVVEIRKNLWNSCADERKNGVKAKLIFDKLKIKNTLYAWNEETKQRFKCQVATSTSNE
ncbi:uncharacterized protein LOC144111926 [Amblyomma americanum]